MNPSAQGGRQEAVTWMHQQRQTIKQYRCKQHAAWVKRNQWTAGVWGGSGSRTSAKTAPTLASSSDSEPEILLLLPRDVDNSVSGAGEQPGQGYIDTRIGLIMLLNEAVRYHLEKATQQTQNSLVAAREKSGDTKTVLSAPGCYSSCDQPLPSRAEFNDRWRRLRNECLSVWDMYHPSLCHSPFHSLSQRSATPQPYCTRHPHASRLSSDTVSHEHEDCEKQDFQPRNPGLHKTAATNNSTRGAVSTEPSPDRPSTLNDNTALYRTPRLMIPMLHGGRYRPPPQALGKLRKEFLQWYLVDPTLSSEEESSV